MAAQTTTPLLPFYSARVKNELCAAMVGKRVSELRTPSLVINKTAMKRNCEALGIITDKFKVKVRVHVKTHKTIEGAELQLKGAKTSAIVCSTLAEAHAFCDSHLASEKILKEVLLGFPMTPDKFSDIFTLTSKVEKFQIFLDRLETLEALEKYHAEHVRDSSKKVYAFIKVDAGYHRAGVPLDSHYSQSLELAKRLTTSSCIELQGLYCHAGHSYDARTPEEALVYLQEECRMARAFQTMFREKAGVDVPFLSIGATPTVRAIVTNEFENVAAALSGISEVHAGAYALLDRQQVATGLCRYSDVAVRVACRVASVYPDRNTALIDGGALAFSKDTAPQGGFGAIVSDEKQVVLLQKVSQEHGILNTCENLSVGQVVKVVPNHCCLACACHLFYLIVQSDDDDTVVDVWVPVRGW